MASIEYTDPCNSVTVVFSDNEGLWGGKIGGNSRMVYVGKGDKLPESISRIGSIHRRYLLKTSQGCQYCQVVKEYNPKPPENPSLLARLKNALRKMVRNYENARSCSKR